VVLERWRDTDVFARTLEQTRDGEPWIVYEGPPTANGHPGTHHVEARVTKDIYPRFQTMRGRHVPRRAGWDCHGLPVELAVEKELGFTGKADIEAYGVAAFNAKCRESVLRHVGEFEEMTRRVGYWVDFDDAYRTMDTAYVESVWWSLKQIHDSGLLVEDFRISPWCPRDQTTLSDHEVSQGYTDLTDPSVYVRLPLIDGPVDADLLIWTTTPWTLVSNTAVAVHPSVVYAVVATDGRPVVVAEPLVTAALGEDTEILQTLTGAELERAKYRRPFELVELPGEANFVVLADYVTTDEGTGLVHQAPAFGADDMLVARQYGLPVVNPVLPNGRFADDVGIVGGVFFKDADEPLMADLKARGLLLRHRPYTHSYPLCWRCDTALIYYATPSWYVRTTARKEELLRENENTDWHPPTIKTGRYGEWLRNNIDWALSRSRYWGTPLPIWRCTAEPKHALVVVGSIAELGEKAGLDLSALDPHRPFVDDVVVPCPDCGGESRRVPEVIDAWYDSGAMPFAQHGYPHVEGSAAEFAKAYPAQMICEGLDQTRGWFYTLMAVNTLLFDTSSYESVLCLGIILDEHGRKMSKHVGNVLDPFEVLDRHGADALRWVMLCQGNPWAARRVGHENLGEVVRSLLLTYWNTASFLTLYADASGFTTGGRWQPTHLLDRWALAETNDAVREVTEALEVFDSVRGGRRLTQLIEDLSNWYVRRSRRRFWDGDSEALATLHLCLHTVTRLLAPFIPFVTDEVWQAIRTADDADSVHLSRWPSVADVDDPGLRAEMRTLRKLVELGRSARTASKVRTRQPLGRALVSAPDLRTELLAELADELNVAEILPLAAQDELVDIVVKPNFRLLGKRFGARTKDVAAQVSAGSYDRASGAVTVTLDGVEHALTGDELLVTETPREGWAVASGDGLSVALDLTLTPELVRAGVAREVTRALNDGRKAAGLEVTDRIELWWTSANEQTALALREHGVQLAKDVLAVSVVEGPPAIDIAQHQEEALDLTWWLRVAGG
jgi:isoleucyl-tRNA synthetase